MSIMVSRDCSVQFDTDGKITIFSSMLKGGKDSTYVKKHARGCLLQIMSLGDSIPIGALDKLEEK